MSLALLKIVIGFALLIWGADLLVRGASSLALRIGISALVVGLTVVAFGTSSPELVVAVQAAMTDRGAIALGTVVGSNICNVILILGISSILRPIKTDNQVLRIDLPIMVGVSLLFTVMIWVSPALTRIHGAVLFSGIIAYTAFTIQRARRESKAVAARVDEEHISSGLGAGLIALFILLGAGLLVVGSNLILDGSVFVAETLGISEAVIGLTIVAVGGSLPELATSISAAVKGKADIAVGNIIGSNLFNILCILGVATVVARPSPLDVKDTVSLVDLVVMNVVAIALFPLMYSGGRLGRREGAVMLTGYVLYVAYLFLAR